MLDTETNGRVIVDGGQNISRAQYLGWRRSVMMALDREPAAFRDRVHEINLAPATEERRIAMTKEKCIHGRYPPSCAQCTYKAATERKRSAAADLARRRMTDGQ